MNNRVIVIDTRQKIFQLQLSTFENFQLQLQQNRVINYNFVNYNYNFSKPDSNANFYLRFSFLLIFFVNPNSKLLTQTQILTSKLAPDPCGNAQESK